MFLLALSLRRLREIKNYVTIWMVRFIMAGLVTLVNWVVLPCSHRLSRHPCLDAVVAVAICAVMHVRGILLSVVIGWKSLQLLGVLRMITLSRS